MPGSNTIAPARIDEVFADGTQVTYAWPRTDRLEDGIVTIDNAILTEPAFPKLRGSEWLHPTGAVYTSDGMLVEESRLRKSQELPSTLENRPGKIRKLPGKWVFLGYYNEIYGHFILESLGRFWALDRLPDEPLNFLYFAMRNYTEYEGHYTEQFLAWSGLQARLEGHRGTRIEIIKEPVQVERMIVPTRAYDIQGEFSPTFSKFSRGLSSRFAKENTPKRLYLSRRLVKPDNHYFINEAELEQVFREQGFEIINPEKLAPGKQLEAYSGAKVLAGPASSALHNSIFCQSDDVHVIALNGRWQVEVRRKMMQRQAPGGGTVRINRSPVSLQDSLAELYGHRLTYVEAYRAFDIGARFPGRMPYWIDAGFARETIARLLDEPPAGNEPARGLTVAALCKMLESLAAMLATSDMFDHANTAIAQAEELGSQLPGIRKRLEWRRSRNIAVQPQVPVRFFPTMHADILADTLAASALEARIVWERMVSSLGAEAGMPEPSHG